MSPRLLAIIDPRPTQPAKLRRPYHVTLDVLDALDHRFTTIDTHQGAPESGGTDTLRFQTWRAGKWTIDIGD